MTEEMTAHAEAVDPDDDAAAPERAGEPFFFGMGLGLLAIVIAGFVPPALIRPGGIAGIPLLLHVHGAVFLGWFVLFCVQARLAGRGRLETHRQLGMTSIALAMAMIVLGFVVTMGAYARTDFSIAGMTPAGSVMFPFTDIVNFTIAYVFAIAMRRKASAHKRLMLVAGILLIDPAAARLVFTLGGAPPAILALELMLFSALIAYDFMTRRRPHWASLVGLGLFAAAMAAKLTLAPTPTWAAFVEGLFG